MSTGTRTLRVGIVGIGNIGSAHARAIYSGEVAGMTLAALCDSDAKKREKLSELYPDVPIFDSHCALFDSGLIDIIDDT